MSDDNRLPKTIHKYVSLKDVRQKGLEMEQVDRSLLEICKNKFLEDISAQDPDFTEKLIDRVARLSATVYVLEREINGIKAPIHKHLRIDPLQQIDIADIQEPAPTQSISISAQDLNPKYGWHALESSQTTSWRWAGGSRRAAILLPPLAKGKYQVRAKIWPFHDFDLSSDLQVNIFGKDLEFTQIKGETEADIWSFNLKQEDISYSTPGVMAFFIHKHCSPSELGLNDDKRQLAFAFERLEITKSLK